MHQPKKGIAGLKENWRKDIFAGFVVSLVALPLSLGLALASGAPPIAGIITAVVGGIIVAILGGSYVTITGPGNGLAVATLASVELLGGGDLVMGWSYTMAAIVVSGGIILLLGILKFGALSDFFPSTAVEGMLSAIGLIILARQLHIMLGIMPEASSTVGYLINLPNSFAQLTTESALLVAGVGIISLFIMLIYPFIKLRIFHSIPAPMWVVLLVIGFSYFMQFQGQNEWLKESMIISFPEQLLDDYSPPNFSKINHGGFWEAVLMLTLIASVESLLSIKGIERIDVFKRKASVNKDLRAHGIATVASGLLGGLNVVTVIARSSVNVNNGARTRNSNLFQALILAAIILLLRDLVVRIPLPALAAILVYTGYKLIEPKKFISISKLGWESVLIFLSTFLLTVIYGIIPGILAGIFSTFTLQLITTRRASLILRNLIKPNTLLYTETEGNYILSIRRYANFLNFIGIKRQLDSIPSGSEVIVDLTLCDFVDNTVMEQLHAYHEFYEQKGGSLEVIGLDDLRAHSDHPFAAWVPTSAKRKKKKTVLSNRQKSLKNYAEIWGHEFLHKSKTKLIEIYHFSFFDAKTLDKLRNELKGNLGDFKFKLLDLDYHSGEFIARETMHATLVQVKVPFNIPDFVLHEEDLLERIAGMAGFKDIDFKKYPDFSRRYYLKGPNSMSIRRFFKPELLSFFESNKTYHLEVKGNRLLVLDKQRFASITEIKMMLDFTSKLLILMAELHNQTNPSETIKTR